MPRLCSGTRMLFLFTALVAGVCKTFQFAPLGGTPHRACGTKPKTKTVRGVYGHNPYPSSNSRSSSNGVPHFGTNQIGSPSTSSSRWQFPFGQASSSTSRLPADHFGTNQISGPQGSYGVQTSRDSQVQLKGAVTGVATAAGAATVLNGVAMFPVLGAVLLPACIAAVASANRSGDLERVLPGIPIRLRSKTPREISGEVPLGQDVPEKPPAKYRISFEGISSNTDADGNPL